MDIALTSHYLQEVLRTQGKTWFLRLAVSEITTIPDRYLPTLSNAANEQLMRAGAIEQPGFLIAQLVNLENRLFEVRAVEVGSPIFTHSV